MSDARQVRTPAGGINVESAGVAVRRSSGAAIVRLRRLDTWSVMRTGFVLSLSIAIVLLVAVLALWTLFAVTGVFDTVGRNADDVLGSSSDVSSWFGFTRVVGLTVLFSGIQIVLTTAALTLLAAIYNLTAGWSGGFEITLSEDR